MKSKLIQGVIALVMLACLPGFTAAVLCQQKTVKTPQKEFTPADLAEMSKNKLVAPTGPTFFVGPSDRNPIFLSIILTDRQGNFTSQLMGVEQVAVLEAILLEAQKFALTNEAVGVDKPIVTRFFNKDEPAFRVEVSKMGENTSFTVTIKEGRKAITVDAGTIKRSSPETPTLFFEMIEKLAAMK